MDKRLVQASNSLALGLVVLLGSVKVKALVKEWVRVLARVWAKV